MNSEEEVVLKGQAERIVVKDTEELTADQVFRVSFIRRSSLIVASLILLTTILRITLSGFSVFKLLPTVFFGILLLVVAHDSRKSMPRAWHSYAMLFSLAAIILNGTFWNGGLRAPIAAGVFLLPLVGAILLGKRGGIIGLF